MGVTQGKVEEGENNQEAALREVSEETGVKADILKYLGEIHYTFKENWDENRAVHKTVLVFDASKEYGYYSTKRGRLY